MNAPETGAGKQPRTAAEASEADVTGAFAARQAAHTGSDDGPGSRPPQAMDRWFDEQLNRLFNDVSSEPLPADLASLVGKLRSQGSKPDDK